MNRKPGSLHIFEVLAKQHEAMLLAYVLSLVSDHKLAEDVAQQSFLIACRTIDSRKDPEALADLIDAKVCLPLRGSSSASANKQTAITPK